MVLNQDFWKQWSSRALQILQEHNEVTCSGKELDNVALIIRPLVDANCDDFLVKIVTRNALRYHVKGLVEESSADRIFQLFKQLSACYSFD